MGDAQDKTQQSRISGCPHKNSQPFRQRQNWQRREGTIDAISDQAFRGHIYKTLKSAPKHHTILTILQMQQPPPSPEEVMRTINTNEEETEVSEPVETTTANTATTADGLYSSQGSGRGNRGGRRGRGRGRGGRNAYSTGRSTSGGRSYRCTHCRIGNRTTAECGKLNRRHEAAPQFPFLTAIYKSARFSKLHHYD